MDRLDFLGNISGETIDELYSKYIEDPNSIDPQWNDFFKGFEFARANYNVSDD